MASDDEIRQAAGRLLNEVAIYATVHADEYDPCFSMDRDIQTVAQGALDLAAEVERLREAGCTVSAHVYASFNPGSIPVFVRQAMLVFEEAAAKKRRAPAPTAPTQEATDG